MIPPTRFLPNPRPIAPIIRIALGRFAGSIRLAFERLAMLGLRVEKPLL